MHVFHRIRNFRDDSGGSVLLLSAMMVFLAVIMTVLAVDTQEAIRRRIIAQNAVDSAAEAAALWEARGCNLIQHLNNIHFEGNRLLFKAESVALLACWTAAGAVPATIVAKPFPPAYAIAMAIAVPACFLCSTAPVIDKGQEAFANAIETAQAVAQKTFPLLALGYANQMAKESGADPFLKVFPQYAAGIAGKLSLPWFEEMGDAPAFLQSMIGNVGIYAVPVTLLGDKDFLDLGLKAKKGEELPWKTPDRWNDVFAKGGYWAGKTACTQLPWEMASTFSSFMQEPPAQWGWTDSYFYGNPGYMTWIAGTTNKAELAGLGIIRWLHGETPPAEVRFTFMDQEGLPMYTGSSLGGRPPLLIPSFVAVASSQVEGEPVVSQTDNVNAEGKLIPVYLPFPSYKRPWPGKNVWIYH